MASPRQSLRPLCRQMIPGPSRSRISQPQHRVMSHHSAPALPQSYDAHQLRPRSAKSPQMVPTRYVSHMSIQHPFLAGVVSSTDHRTPAPPGSSYPCAHISLALSFLVPHRLYCDVTHPPSAQTSAAIRRTPARLSGNVARRLLAHPPGRPHRWRAGASVLARLATHMSLRLGLSCEQQFPMASDNSAARITAEC